jgi:hypothetical protein
MKQSQRDFASGLLISLDKITALKQIECVVFFLRHGFEVRRLFPVDFFSAFNKIFLCQRKV